MTPNRGQIELFVKTLFRHAGPKGYVSIRGFVEGDPKHLPFNPVPTQLTGGLGFVVDVAEDFAGRAANFPKPAVFCPPVCTFSNKDNAREQDILEGVCLTVEADEHPQEARTKLESILGPATMVVYSGGRWIDPDTQEAFDKLHLHWRLDATATGDNLIKLKRARALACRIVGGDASSNPVNHPLRWPGSWHRKSVPTLCGIETCRAETEINLDKAIAALEAVAGPEQRQKANGKDHSAKGSSGWSALVANILAGRELHISIASLAAMAVKAGMDGGAVTNFLRDLMQASAAPRDERWQARFDDIPRAVQTAEQKFRTEAPGQAGTAEGKAPPEQPAPVAITAKTWKWRDPADVGRRKWLHGNHYIRGALTCTVGKRGGGKTNRALAELISMVTRRDLLETGSMPAQPLRIWYIGEDPYDEIERRIVAICDFYGIKADEISDRLLFNSLLDFPPGALKLAAMQGGKLVPNTALVEMIIAEMKTKAIDALILDPLKKFHGLRENDQEMDEVMTILFEIAQRADAAVEFLHHTRKASAGNAGAPITADDARGADAIIASPRDARVTNAMTIKEAADFGIPANEAWRYSRIDDGKQNLKPPGKASWSKSASLLLPCGDSVGVLQPWTPPKPFDGITSRDAEVAQEVAQGGAHRADVQAKNWFGYALGEKLGLDPHNKPADKAKLREMIKIWRKNKVLEVEAREDEQRKTKEFIVPGPTIMGARAEFPGDDDF
jgi:hypothetical protein